MTQDFNNSVVSVAPTGMSRNAGRLVDNEKVSKVLQDLNGAEDRWLVSVYFMRNVVPFF
jgi:hypothetical protein